MPAEQPRPAPPADPSPFRDAESWLAERGIQREPVTRPPSAPPSAPPDAPAATEDPTPISARHAARLAAQQADQQAEAADAAAAVPTPAPRLEDDVAAAVAFIRRSTASTPQSEQRLRDKLAARGTAPVVVEQALADARRQGLVDDAALVAALVEERRQRGHAPARIRRDLAARGFGPQLLDEALAGAEAEDPQAAAFALAQRRAQQLTGIDAEAAVRRVTGYVQRRGYPDALARKAARDAVFATRDDERTAGH